MTCAYVFPQLHLNMGRLHMCLGPKALYEQPLTEPELRPRPGQRHRLVSGAWGLLRVEEGFAWRPRVLIICSVSVFIDQREFGLVYVRNPISWRIGPLPT